MRQIRMLMLAVFALFAFGAVASAVASAEDGQPAVLILSGNVKELEFKGEGKGSTLSVLKSTTSLIGTGVTATLSECLELEGKPLDTNLCHAGLLTFTGVKTGLVACRSETAGGVKDAAETVLVKVDAHLAAEESQEKVLEPLLITKVLGVDGNNDLTIACGLVKVKVLGKIGCLILPGLKQLATTEEAELLCKTDLTEEKPNGDQLTGTCVVTKVLCEELEKEPFVSDLGNGEGPVMGAMLLHIKGKFNKDIFIDD